MQTFCSLSSEFSALSLEHSQSYLCAANCSMTHTHTPLTSDKAPIGARTQPHASNGGVGKEDIPVNPWQVAQPATQLAGEK
eukprot:4518475-Amphidinium_carterae.2